ncbi:hypothetical protein TSOC_002886 [Tetrabaena socialis]|uniref:Uncharacterized protein n=1 Tax=Tetrabaena socialis TaxID=47790 RepID=A0A2J8ACZ6_9CHLO|nr:hypothetical protein TSOC_002886 [Tetrabaena socialis]|eukprot:PNH10387.1 hypothetical protein TSOC_002886 [Tetrabaena socialis]
MAPSLKVTPVSPIIPLDRLKDGSSFFANFRPASNSSENVGRYQFTPGQTAARYPQVAYATGYYLSSKDIDTYSNKLSKFALADPEYARQLEQVYWFGSINSTNRSDYDSASPRFWALGSGTGTVAGTWLNISISVLPASTPLIHQARFFKLLASSFWDAGTAWTFHGVRPADPTWTPLLATPAHPEYPSGHQCSTGAAVYVLEAYLGTNFTFSATSSGAPDLGARTYPSFRAAGVEAGDSRLYAGVHFNKSNVDGSELGYNIAKHIHTKHFKGITFADAL